MSKYKKLNKALISESEIKIDIEYTDKPISYNITLGDFNKIDKIKNKIDDVNQEDWTKIRKYTNKYESPFYNTSRKVISRAFYKLWELLLDYKISCNSETLHLCEAPGGFIQATIDYKLKKYNEIKKCHTISLIDDDNSDTPKYNQSISNNTNVNIIKDYNGNLYNIDLILHSCYLLKNNNISLVTGDGGIAENGNFNNKEVIHIRLILSQMFLTFNILEDFGTFILKIFDIYTDITSEIIYLLSYLFDEVYITKPLTSRPTNSEKYLICKGFIKKNFTINIKNELFKCLKKLSDNPELQVCRLFNNNLVDNYNRYINQLSEYNTCFMSQQIENIEKNLKLLDNNNNINYYNFIGKRNVFSRKWLIKYRLIY